MSKDPKIIEEVNDEVKLHIENNEYIGVLFTASDLKEFRTLIQGPINQNFKVRKQLVLKIGDKEYEATWKQLLEIFSLPEEEIYYLISGL